MFTLVVSESLDEQQAECSAEVLVAYCSYGTQWVEFEALITQRFLSTLQSKVIYPGIGETVSLLAPPDADDDQRTVKFTWRYADDIPQFAPAQLLADGIFSAPYNPLFS